MNEHGYRHTPGKTAIAARAREISRLSTSPSIRNASSAATLNVSISRETSPRESPDRLAGLDAQRGGHFLGALAEACVQCSSTAWRWYGAKRRSGSCAATAAAIAASIAFASASATRVATLPVYLSVTSRSCSGDRLAGKVIGIGFGEHGILLAVLACTASRRARSVQIARLSSRISWLSTRSLSE